MYKCSVKAQLVLDQVRARCQADSQTNNRWTGRSGNYMIIMGRENPDGKATGVVHKFQDLLDCHLRTGEILWVLLKKIMTQIILMKLNLQKFLLQKKAK